MLDFWGRGFDVAERMGLLPSIRERGYLIDRLRFVDSSGFTRSEVEVTIRRALGNRFVSIPRGELARVIFERARSRAEMVFGDTVAAVDEDEGAVRARWRAAFRSAGRSRWSALPGKRAPSAGVYALCDRGELPHLRVSNAIRLRVEDLEGFTRRGPPSSPPRCLPERRVCPAGRGRRRSVRTQPDAGLQAHGSRAYRSRAYRSGTRESRRDLRVGPVRLWPEWLRSSPTTTLQHR